MVAPICRFLLVLILAAGGARAADARVSLDVLLRLKGANLDTNPTLRAALQRALEENQGTPAFLDLVRAFELKDQVPGLIRLAAALPGESAGAEALQRAIDDGGIDRIRQSLAGPDAAKIVQALGNISNDAAPALLQPLAADPALAAALRLAAVRALAQSGAGAAALIELARAGTLPPDARAAATAALAASPSAEIKEAAAEILPPTAPPPGTEVDLAAVLRLQGNAARGEGIFHGAAACFACHRANGRGADVGPDLSTIGDKFAKPAMFASIVEPSAGISFGYELWNLELRNGSASGMIASETDDEVALKSASGITIRYRKADIVRRTAATASLMPPGLLAGLSPQETADLLEFLASLKKPEAR